MMDLANQIIERQNHLKSENFRVGFKIDAFMQSLTMHVISDDFYSESMKRVKHWNSFNTDLFLTYQAVYAMLRLQGFIDPLPDDEADKLRQAMPLHCNQCDFSSDILLGLKGHLYEHWRKRERKFEVQKQVDHLTSLLDEATLDAKPSTNADEVLPKVEPTEKSLNIKPKEDPASWRRKTPMEPETLNQNNRGSNNTNRPGLFPIPNCPPLARQQPFFNPQSGNRMFQQGYQHPQQMGNGAAQPHFNPFRQTPNPSQVVPFRFNGPRPQFNQIQNIPQAQGYMGKPNWRPKGQLNQSQANNQGSNNHQPNKNEKYKPNAKPICQEPKVKNSVNQNQNQNPTEKPLESVTPKQSSPSAALKPDQAAGDAPTNNGKPVFKKKWHKKKESNTVQSVGSRQYNKKSTTDVAK